MKQNETFTQLLANLKQYNYEYFLYVTKFCYPRVYLYTSIFLIVEENSHAYVDRPACCTRWFGCLFQSSLRQRRLAWEPYRFARGTECQTSSCMRFRLGRPRSTWGSRKTRRPSRSTRRFCPLPRARRQTAGIHRSGRMSDLCLE